MNLSHKAQSNMTSVYTGLMSVSVPKDVVDCSGTEVQARMPFPLPHAGVQRAAALILPRCREQPSVLWAVLLHTGNLPVAGTAGASPEGMAGPAARLSAPAQGPRATLPARRSAGPATRSASNHRMLAFMA